MFSWTDEAIATLKQMGEAKNTASEIARVLGCTRNAVIGKTHRIGCQLTPKDNSGQVKTLRPKKNPKLIQLRRFKEKQLPEREMPQEIQSLNIGFMDLQDNQCREVMGQGEDGLAVYCGHVRHRTSSYCSFHSSVNEHLAPPRVRRAA